MRHILAILLLAFSLTVTARAEDAGQAYSYIANLGQMSFSQGGAVSIPGYVLGSMRSGQVSPLMQFVLVNSMMNKCIKDTYNFYPRRRDPFQLANAKFAYGVCKIQKCYQQGMLLLLLPKLSGRSQYGGADGQSSGQQTGALLAQAFAGGAKCGGSSNDSGISAALLQAFGSGR